MPNTAATQPRIEGHVRIGQPWLNILRGVWLIAMLAALAVLVLALPGYVHPIRQATLGATLSVDAPEGVARAIATAVASASLFSTLLSLSLSALLFWRRSDHVMALLLSFDMMFYGILTSGPAEHLEYLVPGITEPFLTFGGALTAWMLPLVAGLFPNARWVPRWAKWLVPLAFMMGGLQAARYLLPLPGWLGGVETATMVILIVMMLGAQVYRYRYVSTPSERQQTKWVLYGMALWMLVIALSALPYQLVQGLPEDAPLPLWAASLGLFWFASTAILPLAFTIALLRHHLWDVDVVIRRTVQYAAVTAVLGAVYFGTVVLAQSALVALTGQRSQLAIVLSTLAVAALFTPVRQRLQQLVDRAFYRKSYDAEQTLARFGEAVQSEMDVDGVEAALLRAVNDTLQPTSAGLWVPEVER